MEEEDYQNNKAINAEGENEEEYSKPIEDESQQYLNPHENTNSKTNDLVRLDSHLTANSIRKDEKDVIIEKLKEGNRKLRKKLEEVVERTTTKLKTESLHHSKLKQQFEEYESEFRRKSKELKTAHLQLEVARKEIRSLTYKIEVTNNEEAYNQLISSNNELKKENDDLQREIKALEKIQNDQGKQLQKVADETDFF